MKPEQIINYAEFINKNLDQLKENYNSRDIDTDFYEWISFVYVGLKNNCWLPKQYTEGIVKN